MAVLENKRFDFIVLMPRRDQTIMQALQDMMIRMMLIEDDMKRIQYVRKIVA